MLFRSYPLRFIALASDTFLLFLSLAIGVQVSKGRAKSVHECVKLSIGVRYRQLTLADKASLSRVVQALGVRLGMHEL